MKTVTNSTNTQRFSHAGLNYGIERQDNLQVQALYCIIVLMVGLVVYSSQLEALDWNFAISNTHNG